MGVPEAVARGVHHFNRGDYFEAHEAWEDHWGAGGREEREATLGLVKAAVALHHLEAGNLPGFLWQAGEAAPRLRAHGGVWPHLDLPGLAEALESLASQCRFRRGIPQGWERPQIGRGG